MGYDLCVYNIWLVLTKERIFISCETIFFNYICLSLEIRHFDKYLRRIYSVFSYNNSLGKFIFITLPPPYRDE